MPAVRTWIMVLIAGLGASGAFAAPPAGPGYGWKLVFEDDFSGGSLDTSKWIDRYPWGATHNHDAYMRAENLTVANGVLTITAKAESYGGKPFTSGAISTGYNKFRFRYGYAEARMNMPSTRGSWPAFWCLDDGWPPELDILEFPLDTTWGQSNQLWRYWVNYHYTADGGGHASVGDQIWQGDNLSSGYHNYAVQWAPGALSFHFDDQAKRTWTGGMIDQSDGMYLILNYAVGGNWPGQVLGDPDPAAWPAGGDTLQVDWVRVWQRNRDPIEECTGYWPLDESSGTLATDACGQDRHGTLRNGLSFTGDSVPGARGAALEFDGQDDYIDLPDGFGELDNGFSVCLWARPAAVKQWARFIDFGNGPDDNNIYLARRSTTNDLIFGVYDGGTGHYLTAPEAIENHQWHFYAATVAPSGQAILYKDGLRIRCGALVWPWSVVRTGNYLGRSNWSADEYYQGALDDVRTFDYALSHNDIARQYGLAAVVVENYGFELPGTTKQSTWQNVPGWNSDTVAVDSGVESNWAPTQASWSGFLMGGDPAVWQLTDHVILPHTVYRLQIDAENNWDATQLRLGLYYDNGGIRIPAAGRTVDLADENGSGQKQPFTLYFSSADLPAAAGHRLGIELDNPAGGWAGFDNVHLSYEVHLCDSAPDLNRDDRVDLRDVAILAGHWLRQDCTEPFWCDCADLDHSGTVNLRDVWSLARDYE